MYNTNARHEQHECDTSDTNATQVRSKCDTSQKIWILITTRVKTYFHIPIFTIWEVKDYKERNNLIKVRPLAMPHSQAKIRLKSVPQKLDFAMVKAVSKSYTLDCSCKFLCTFPHSYA